MKKHRQGTEPEEVLFLVYKNTVSYLAHFVKHLGQGLSARLRIPCAAAKRRVDLRLVKVN